MHETLTNAGSIPGSGISPWRTKWQPNPVFLPEKSYGQRSLVGYSSWSCKSQTLLSVLTAPLPFLSLEIPEDEQLSGKKKTSIFNILNLKYADVEYAIRYIIELRKWCMLEIQRGKSSAYHVVIKVKSG